MLYCKFEVLNTTVNCNVESVDNIKWICILHNSFRTKEGKMCQPPTSENNSDVDVIVPHTFSNHILVDLLLKLCN
jgi:hypothetical protein